jgi:hypothetical protein
VAALREELRDQAEKMRKNDKAMVNEALTSDSAAPLVTQIFVQCPRQSTDFAHNYILNRDVMCLYRKAFIDEDDVSFLLTFYTLLMRLCVW